jgi:uncharacterized repeat protein (TIGR01451 family)
MTSKLSHYRIAGRASAVAVVVFLALLLALTAAGLTPAGVAQAAPLQQPPPVCINYNAGPITVPGGNDPQTGTGTINVPEGGTVVDVNVLLQEFTAVTAIGGADADLQDYVFTLTGPGGPRILADDGGADGMTGDVALGIDILQLTFDDDGAQAIGGQAALVGPGSFRPFESLSFFNGQAGNAAPWDLSITRNDGNAGSPSTSLTQWMLQICYAPEADIIANKSAATPDLVPGATKSFTIEVSNAGPMTATGVVVLDNAYKWDPILDNIYGDDRLNYARGADGQSFARLSPLGVGVTDTLTLDYLVPSNAHLLTGDTPANCVSATSSMSDTNQANNSFDNVLDPDQCVDLDFAPQSDLRIEKKALTPEAVQRGLALFQVTVYNDGPSDVAGVVISDMIPAGFVNQIVSPAEAFGPNGLMIPAGGHVNVMVSLVVDDLQPPFSIITNTAEVTVPVGYTDPDPTNNSASDFVIVLDTDLVPVDIDVSSTIIDVTNPIVAGAPYQFVIEVTNNTTTTAEGVIVHDILQGLPAGLSVTDVITAPNWFCGLGLTCSRQNPMPIGTETVATVTVMLPGNTAPGVYNHLLSATADNPDFVPENNIATFPFTVTTAATIGIAKTTLITEAVAGGDAVLFRIAVTNTGSSDAYNVLVTDTVDAGMTIISLSSSNVNATCVAATGVCQIPVIPAGTVAVLDVWVLVDSDAIPSVVAGAYDNTATLGGCTNDVCTIQPAIATASIDVVRHTDMAVVKFGPIQATTGDLVTYTVSLINNGPSDSNLIVLADVLPPGINFVASNGLAVAGQYNVAVLCTPQLPVPLPVLGQGEIVACVLLNANGPGDTVLPAGDQLTFEFTAQIDPNVCFEGTLVNHIGVAAPGTLFDPFLQQLAGAFNGVPPIYDTDLSNNFAEWSTEVAGSADLVITKTVTGTTIAGQTATFVLTVANAGPGCAGDVRVIDELNWQGNPTGLEQVLYDASQSTAGNLGGPLSGLYYACTSGVCERGAPMAAGITDTIIITVAVPAGTVAQQYVNVADVFSATPDPDEANNSTFADYVVATNAVVRITKREMADPFVIDTLTTANIVDIGQYVLRIENRGPSDAANVVVTDTLPAGLVRSNAALIAYPSYDQPGLVNGPSALGNPTFAMTITSLPAGESIEVVVPVGVDPALDAAGVAALCDTNVDNTASITWEDTLLPPPGNRRNDDTSNTATTNLICKGDIDLIKVGPASLAFTDLLTSGLVYTLTVTNIGPSPAPTGTVVISDMLPMGMEFGAITDAGSCAFTTAATAGMTGTVGFISGAALGAGESCLLSISTTVVDVNDPNFCLNRNVFNSAIVSLGDVTNDMAQASWMTYVNECPYLPPVDIDVTATITDLVTPIVAGLPYSFTIEVSNRITNPAEGVIVHELLQGLPAIQVLNVVAAPNYFCDAGVNCSRQNPMPGLSTETVATVTVLIPANTAPGVYNHLLSATADNPDIDPSNNSATFPFTVTTEAVLSVLKEDVSDPAVIGNLGGMNVVYYMISITNTGPSDAVNVALTDTMPPGMQSGVDTWLIQRSYAGGNSTCAYTPGATVQLCDLGTIPAGESVTIHAVVAASGPQLCGSLPVNRVNNRVDIGWVDTTGPNTAFNIQGTDIQCRGELDLIKQGPATAVVGDVVTYQITVTNDGPSPIPAGQLRLTDNLPAGLTFGGLTNVSGAYVLSVTPLVTTTYANCGFAGGPPTWTNANALGASVPPSASGPVSGSCSVIITATVTAAACPAGIIFNEASLIDQDSNIAQSVWPTRIDCGTTLDIEKRPYRFNEYPVGRPITRPLAGAPFSFEIVITNTGTVTAYHPELTDEVIAPLLLDAQIVDFYIGLANNFGFVPQGGECSDTAGYCNLPDIPPGGSMEVIATVMMDPSTGYGDTNPPKDLLINKASVRADNALVVSDEYSDTVQTESVLSVFKEDVSDPAVIGNLGGMNTVHYMVSISNTGPSDAVNVVLTDTMPPFMQSGVDLWLINRSYAGGSSACAYTPGVSIQRCEIGTIPAGERVTIHAVTAASGPQLCGALPVNRVTNRVDITWGDKDALGLTPNSAFTTQGTDILCRGDLDLKKTGPERAKVGDVITYQITVTNDGPSPIPAGQLRLVDELPVGLNYVGYANASGAYVLSANPLVTTTYFNCGFAGGPPTWTNGNALPASVPPNASGLVSGSCSVIITATVTPAACPAGIIFNEAQLHDQDSNIAQALWPTQIDCSTTLDIDKRPYRFNEYPVGRPITRPLAGAPFSFEIVITNTGTVTAYHPELTDEVIAPLLLDAQIVDFYIGLANNFGFVPQGGECSDTAGYCNLPDIPPGGSMEVIATVLMDPSTGYGNTNPPKDLLINRASVRADNAIAVSDEYSDTVQTESVLSVFKEDVSDPAVIGNLGGMNTVYYMISISNTGPSDAVGVVLTDTMPAFMRSGVDLWLVNRSYAGGSSACAYTPGANPQRCEIGTIPAGERVTIHAVTEASGPELCGTDATNRISNRVDIAWGDKDALGLAPNTAFSVQGTDIQCRGDLDLIKRGPATAKVGDLVTYQITVTNDGVSPIPAGQLRLTDILPVGLQYVSSQNVSGSYVLSLPGGQSQFLTTDYVNCGFAGGPPTWTNGNALPASVPGADGTPPSGSCSVVITATVTPAACPTGLAYNVVYNEASLIDQDSNLAQAIWPTRIDCGTTLAIAKVPYRFNEYPVGTPIALPLAGAPFSFELVITNTGTVTAIHPELTDEVIAPLLLDAEIVDFYIFDNSFGYVSLGGECSDATGYCNLPNIPPGKSIIVVATVMMDPSTGYGNTFPPKDTLINRASVRADNAAAVFAEITLPVQTESVLSVFKEDVSDPAVIGNLGGMNTVYYMISISNTGPSDAVGVVLTDTMPPFMTSGVDLWLINRSYAGGNPACVYTPGANPQRCEIGTIPAGERVTIHAVVQASGPELCGTDATNRISNRVDITWGDKDALGLAPNTAFSVQGTDIQCRGDLDLIKRGPATAKVGDLVTYQITVTNDGVSPIPAGQLRLTDILPVGLQYVSSQNVSGSYVLSLPGGQSQFLTTDYVNCGFAGGPPTWTNGNALPASVPGADGTPPSGSCSVVITATVTPAACASELPYEILFNEASLIDQDSNLAQSVWPTRIDCGTILAINKNVIYPNGGASVAPGELVTFTLSVTNAGTVPAFGVVVQDLPVGFEYTIVNAQAPADYTRSAGLTFLRTTPLDVYSATLGGPTDLFTITLLVNNDSNQVISINAANYGYVTAENSPKVSDWVDVNIAPVADLWVKKTKLAAHVAPNDIVFFHVEVFNLGPSDIIAPMSTFTLTDVLSGDGVIEAVSSQYCGIYDGDTIICRGIELDMGDKFDIFVSVRADWDAMPGDEITNTASVTTGNIVGFVDPNMANNSDTSIVPIWVKDTDLSVYKYVKPDGKVVAGNKFTYTIFVDNWGPSPALSVTVSDTMFSNGVFQVLSISSNRANAVCPARTVPAGGVPTGLVNPFTFDCFLPVFEIGGRWIITATAIASETQDVNNNVRVWMAPPYKDINPDNNIDEASIHVIDTADLSIIKRGAPASVVAGEWLTYTLLVANAGPSEATAVVVKDVLPLGLMIANGGITASQGSCGTVQNATDNTEVTCNLGDIAVGGQATITIVSKVDPAVPSGAVLFNEATVASAEFDPATQNNISSVSTPVTVLSNIAINKGDAPDPVTAGTEVEYVIRVQNTGPSMARNLRVVDNIGAELQHLTLISARTAGGDPVDCFVSVVGAAVRCTVGDMPVGETQVVYLRFMVNPATPVMMLDDNITLVADSVVTPTVGSDLVETTAVTRSTSLSINKTASVAEPVAAGVSFYYNVAVTNNGPSTAEAVTVVDTLPAEVSYMFSTNAGCSEAGGIVTCNLGTLGVGQTVSFDIYVRADVDVTPGSTIVNTATATSITPSQPVTDTAEVEVQSVADLAIRKFGKPDAAVRAGDTLTYTVIVDNFGPSMAHSVVVTDMLAASGSYWLVNAPMCAPATGAYSGNQQITCALGDMLPGAQMVFTITATANEPQSINNVADVSSLSDDPNMANNHAIVEHEITAVTDLSVVKSGPATATAGLPIAYVLTVTNDGPSTAENVVLYDYVPAGVVMVSATPAQGSCTVNAMTSMVACGLGTLTPGQSVTVDVVGIVAADVLGGVVLTNNAHVSAGTFDDDNSNNYAAFDTMVESVANLTIEKSAYTESGGGVTVIAGEQIEYSLSVFNAGPSLASNVMVVDYMPADVYVISVAIETQPGAFCNVLTTQPQLVVCNLGNVMPGEAEEIVITAMVDPGVPDGDVLTNQASTEADNGLFVLSNEVTTTVDAIAALSVVKTASTFEPVAGQNFFYTVKVSNAGPSVATDVLVTDTLPAEVTYLYATDAGCVEIAGVVVCDLGDLAPGASVSFDIYVKVNVDVAPDALVVNRAVASSPDSPDASGEVAVEVQSVADLKVRKFGKPDAAVRAGDTLTYTVIVDNFGPSMAHSVVVTDMLAASGSYWLVNAPMCAPANGVYSGNQQITCALGDMLPGAQMVFTITVTANEPQSINNVADVSSLSDDPNMANNHAIVEHEITAVTDLSVVKSGPVTATAGLPIAYVLTVTNDGPSTAENVVLYDYVPAGVVMVSATPAQGSCTVNAMTSMVACGLGTLTPGQSVIVDVAGVVAADVPGGVVLTNNAHVSAGTFDDDNSNNYAAFDTMVESVANLTIDKAAYTESGGGVTVIAGEQIEYSLNVFNTGPSMASNVMVYDYMPADVYVLAVSVPTQPGATCDVLTTQPEQVVCNLGNVMPDELEEIVITAVVDPSVPDGTVLTNRSSVEADNGQPVDSNAVDTTVISEADVWITKTASTGSPMPGETYKYHISLYNDGLSTAFDVMVLDVLPAEVTFVDSTLNPDCADLGGNVYQCMVGDMLPGEWVSFDIIVRLDENAVNGQVLTNEATATWTSGTASARATVMVDGSADLRVTKFVKPDGVVNAGTPFVYTIFVDNLGPSPAYTVTVTDTMFASGQFKVLSASGGCAPASSGLVSQFMITCAAGQLAPYGRWTINVTAVASDTMDVNNEVRVMAADPVDLDTSDNFDSAAIHVQAVADLSIAKSATVTQAVAGTGFSYWITVTNHGVSTAQNVVVVDVLPLGLSVNGAITAPAGASCALTQSAEGNPVITCNLGAMAKDAVANIVIPVMANAAVPAGEIINMAKVSSDTADPDTGDNQATATVAVMSLAELEVEKESYTLDGMVIAGKQIEYSIYVTNNGPSIAKDVMVADELPLGLHILAVNVPSQLGAQCSIRTTQPEFVDCNLGDILPDETEQIVVTAMIDANVPAGTVITNTAESYAANAIVAESNVVTDTVEAMAQITVNKTASAANPSTGEVFYYLVRVSNAGPSTAQDVMITDTLPAGVTFKWAEGAACSTAGSVVTCWLHAIEPGAAKEVKLYVQVNVDVADNATLTNVVIATTSTDSNSPVSDDASVVINTLADLSIRKFGKPDGQAWAGQPLVYTIIVDNFGPGVAHNVVVTDLIASSGVFSFVAQGCTPANGNANGSQQVTCALGNMMPGAQKILTMTVMSETPISINNTADVSGDDEDPDMSNNHARVEHEITAKADLTIVKMAPVTVTSGSTMQYTIKVTNTGPSTAMDVVVMDYLPAGLTVLSVAPSQGNCPQVGATVKCNLGNLASGAGATVTIMVSVNANLADGTALINGATVTSATYDNNAGNNSATTSTTVRANFLLEVKKTASKSLAAPGDSVDWKISVKNVGVSALFDIMLVDTLPAGFTFIAGDSIPAGKVSCAALFGQDINCVIDSLQPGKSVMIFVRTEVNADTLAGVKTNVIASDPIFSGSSVLTASVNITVNTDLRISAQANPVAALTGEVVVWSYEVTNDGMAVAKDVKLSVTLPAGITYLGDALNSAAPQAVAAGVSDVNALTAMCGSALQNCSLGDLKPGQKVVFQVTTLVADNAACETALAAPGQVSSVTPEANMANNVATPIVYTDCAADLAITKIAKPDGIVQAGGEIRYSLIVRNMGPSTAYSVTVTDQMLSDVGRDKKGTFQITSINPNVNGQFPNAKCTPAAPFTVTDFNETVVCVPGQPMAKDTRWEILITVVSNDALDINNLATVDSVTSDPNGENNWALVERSIACISDPAVELTLSKTATGQLIPGTTVVFDLAYANLSNMDAACVTLADEVPDLTTFLSSASTPGWSCPNGSPAGTLCIFNLGPVKAGASGVVKFGVKVVDSIGTTTAVTNTATIRTPGEENVKNNTDDAVIKAPPPTADPEVTEPAGPVLDKRIYLPVINR